MNFNGDKDDTDIDGAFFKGLKFLDPTAPYVFASKALEGELASDVSI